LTDLESIKTLAGGMFENNEWLKKLGIEPTPLGMFQPEYPELPGSETVRTWGNGRGTFGGTRYLPIRKQKEDRGIPVMYQTHAGELIRNEEGEIIGIKAETEGGTIFIKAGRCVILACGGFEFAEDIQRQFLLGWPM
jgi:hypothetical protein